MKPLSVTDNSKTSFSIDSQKKDLENLRKIGNKTISDLQKEDSGLLVFPPKLGETDDRIQDEIIFNLIERENDFELQTGNIMGFIGRNDTELNICSRFTHKVDGKVSEKNDFFLHYMLEKVCHVNLTNLKSTSTSDKIFDFLPFMFPQYLIAALKQGLYKEYQTKQYNDSNVRGVIDVTRHIRFNIPANGKIAYHTREYSYDNSVTELVRHTIEYMRTSEMFRRILNRDQETKDAVSKIDNATPLYNRLERNKILAKTSRAIKSPYFYKYRDLQKICRMILLREKIKYDSSKNKIFGILFDGAWLWEEYLATILTKKDVGFKHPENKLGKGGIYLFEKQEEAEQEIDWHSRCKRYPDFYKRDECYPANTVILDAKYKHLESGHIDRDDMHQIISYMHVEESKHGAYIFPDSKTEDNVSNRKLGVIRGYGGEIFTIGVKCNHSASSYEEYVKKMNDVEKDLILSMEHK